MNTASLALCEELYEVSGWWDTEYTWAEVLEQSVVLHTVFQGRHIREAEETYPAYDLGYLLSRLPPQTHIKKEFDASPELPEETPAHYRALYDTVDARHFWLGADTSEDAAAKLAIELFKHGILKKED